MNAPIGAIEKILEFAASGFGGAVGSAFLSTWIARRKVKAKMIAAKGEARGLQIQAAAHAEARRMLLSSDESISGTLDISERIHQRIHFREQKRQHNIESVMIEAARQLGDKMVDDDEPDHDWTASFFDHVQDVSSRDMQVLWTRVLAGEVEQQGSISVRTLGILKNLDQSTACLFRRLCSACVFLFNRKGEMLDARVSSLSGRASQNSLKSHGLDFNVLNRLHEYGLIISDYDSWFEYPLAVSLSDSDQRTMPVPLVFQGKTWVLMPQDNRKIDQPHRLSGVALSLSGRELAGVVELENMEGYMKDLRSYFLNDQLQICQTTRDVRNPWIMLPTPK